MPREHEYDLATGRNELLEMLRENLLVCLNNEIHDARSSDFISSELDYQLGEAEYTIDMTITKSLDELQHNIDPNKEYDLFECTYFKSEGAFSDKMIFHRNCKISSVCPGSNPDHLQVVWLLDSEDGLSDTVLFGSSIPKESRAKFMRTRVGDRIFTFSQ